VSIDWETEPSMESISLFPVAIGKYEAPEFDELNVDREIGRLIELLAIVGAKPSSWTTRNDTQDATQIERRLNLWASGDDQVGIARGSILYWVGHGWSDGAEASLAHSGSPARVGEAGVTPGHLADVIRRRQELASYRTQDEAWTMVIVDTCRSRRFVERLASKLKESNPPQRVILIGTSNEGATTLGRFTDALRSAIFATYRANKKVALVDFIAQFHRLLPGCEICPIGDLTGIELDIIDTKTESLVSSSLDELRYLEDVVADLGADERSHFFNKALGTEQGEISWFFEGRREERSRIAKWLVEAENGMLVVTGSAGSGKSALLGNILVSSQPELREALIRRSLLDVESDVDPPPNHAFDAVIYLSGLTLQQIVARLAKAGDFGVSPSERSVNTGAESDVDWIIDRFRSRAERFTLLVDALDEALDPLATAHSLLCRIAALEHVRVIVGTRRSTKEASGKRIRDYNILEALLSSPADGDETDGSGPLGDDGFPARVGENCIQLRHETAAIRRYVRRRLEMARHRGMPSGSRHQRDPLESLDTDKIGEISDFIAVQRREFLHARLAVSEILAEPGLLSPNRKWSLEALLRGSYEDLFASALERLRSIDDRFPILLEALAYIHGRGVPEADGIWATMASAISRRSVSPQPGELDRRHFTISANDFGKAVYELLNHAEAYIIVDAPSKIFGDEAAASESGFRLANRALADYFHARRGDGLTEIAAFVAEDLLALAAGLAGQPGLRFPAYLSRYLTAHTAEAGEWDRLASHASVLDRLDPYYVTADVLRSAFGARTIPPEIIGILGRREVIYQSAMRNRPGQRQLSMLMHGSDPNTGEEVRSGWGVRDGNVEQSTFHVQLKGHRATVNCVRPLRLPGGGTLLISGADDGVIRLWYLDTAMPYGSPIAGPGSTVEDVCVFSASNGSPRLAVGCNNGEIWVYDPLRGTTSMPPFTGHAGRVWSLCTVPGWDRRGEKNGRRFLVSAGEDGAIRIWDAATGEQIGDALLGHTGRVLSLCTLPRALEDRESNPHDLLASGGQDGAIKIWDLVAGPTVVGALEGHRGGIWDLATTPGWGADGEYDGRTFLASAGQDGTIRIWNPGPSEQVSKLSGGHAGRIWGICNIPGWTPGAGLDGRTFLASGGQDGTIRVWDPRTENEIGGALVGHTGRVLSVCALRSPVKSVGTAPRTLLASAGQDGTIRIWDPLTDGKNRRYQPKRLRGICAVTHRGPGADGGGNESVAVVGDDGMVRIWDPAIGKRRAASNGPDLFATMAVCRFRSPSPFDGARQDELLATGGADGSIRLWDPRTGEPIGSPFEGHDGRVRGICAMPIDPAATGDRARTVLATAGQDGTVRMWDPVTGGPLGKPMTGHNGPVLAVCTVRNPDFRRSGAAAHFIASAGQDGTVRVWDPVSQTEALRPLAGHRGGVWSICSVPRSGGDGSAVAADMLGSAGEDGTIRLWDLSTGAQTAAPFTGHDGAVLAICSFRSQDTLGSTALDVFLASAGEDGTVRVWSVPERRQVGVPASESAAVVEAVFPTGVSGAEYTTIAGDGGLKFHPQVSHAPDIPAVGECASTGVLAQTDDGRLLLTGDLHGRVQAWRMDGVPRVTGMTPISEGALLTSCLFREAGPEVAFGDSDGSITIVEAGEAPVVTNAFRSHTGPVRALCPLPDYPVYGALASAGNDGLIRLWDAVQGEAIGDAVHGHSGWIWSLESMASAAEGESRVISAGADKTVRIWKLRSDRVESVVLEGHEGPVRTAIGICTPDGRELLASGGHEGSIILWNSRSGRIVRTIKLGFPVNALRQLPWNEASAARTRDGCTMLVGTQIGYLAIDVHRSLF
jgi:WD40 repeat protein